MRTHVQKLSACVDRLRERNLNIDEIQVVSKALATLPEKFRVVRSVWSGVPVNERTMDTLLQRLLSEENVMESYSKQGTSNDGAFFVGNRGGFGRGNYRGNQNGFREGFINKNGRGNYQNSNDTRPRCNYCKIRGHEEKDCFKKKKAEQMSNNQEWGMTSSTSFDPRSVFAFFADSGATRHMSDQKSFFSNFSSIEEGKWSVSGSKQPFPLSDILYFMFIISL